MARNLNLSFHSVSGFSPGYKGVKTMRLNLSILGFVFTVVVGLAGCWPAGDEIEGEVPTGHLTLAVSQKDIGALAMLMESGMIAAPPARPNKVKAEVRWFDNANVRQVAQGQASLGELITVGRPLDRSYVVSVADMDNRSLTGIVRMATRDGFPKAVIPQRAFLPMMEGLVVGETVDGSFDFPSAPIQPVIGTGVDGRLFILEFEVEVSTATINAGGNADTLVASATVSHALGDSIRREPLWDTGTALRYARAIWNPNYQYVLVAHRAGQPVDAKIRVRTLGVRDDAGTITATTGEWVTLPKVDITITVSLAWVNGAIVPTPVTPVSGLRWELIQQGLDLLYSAGGGGGGTPTPDPSGATIKNEGGIWKLAGITAAHLLPQTPVSKITQVRVFYKQDAAAPQMDITMDFQVADGKLSATSKDFVPSGGVGNIYFNTSDGQVVWLNRSGVTLAGGLKLASFPGIEGFTNTP